MNLFETKKFKSLLLVGTLSLSFFFGGCSNNTATLSSASGYSSSEEQDNYGTLNNISVPEESIEAFIERVVDGDTMKVKLKDSGEIVTLRLLLIDTPESVKPGVDPQPYSIEASDFAKELLQQGDKVYIEYDDGDKTDKYDRYLCYLWFYNKEDASWKMYNEKIIENGFARVGYIYSQRRYLDTLYRAQDKAKDKKLNIWSVSGYVTDKGFDVEAYNNSGGVALNSSSNTDKSNSNETVYANGGNSSSNKYHSSEYAHGMRGAIKMTEPEAESKGYSPCQLCY